MRYLILAAGMGKRMRPPGAASPAHGVPRGHVGPQPQLPKCLIEIDGGVGANNAADLVRHGADVLVAGNSVFNTPDPVMSIAVLSGTLEG